MQSNNVKYAAAGSGLSLPYIEKGDLSGPAVVFLHGLSDSHRSFDLLLPHIPDSYRSIAVTQRGHGEAQRPVLAFDAADLAADIRRFLDSLEIDSAVIVGHSMGSFVAQKFAAEYPERVDGLVLIGAFAAFSENEAAIEFVSSSIDTLGDPVTESFVRQFQASTFAKALPDDFFETIVKESLKLPANVWKFVCKAMIDTDLIPLLEKIKAETLLIWGERDGFISRDDQTTLLANIANSTLSVYEGVGHAPHWEEPERVAGEIVRFAARTAMGSVVPAVPG